MRPFIYGQFFHVWSIQCITSIQNIFYKYIDIYINILIKKKLYQTVLFAYCLFSELGYSNQLTSARSKHRVLRRWCLCCRRGTSDHRPTQPVHRPHLAPLVCTCTRCVTSNATAICQSIVTSTLSKCWSCLTICEFLAPQEGTMSSAPAGGSLSLVKALLWAPLCKILGNGTAGCFLFPCV